MRGERGLGLWGDTESSATCHLTKAPQKLLSSQPDSGDSIHLFCFCGVFLSGEQELLSGMILSHCCSYTTFSSIIPVLPKHGWRSHSFFLACTEKNKVKWSLPKDEETACCGGWGWGFISTVFPGQQTLDYIPFCVCISLWEWRMGERPRDLWACTEAHFSHDEALCACPSSYIHSWRMSWWEPGVISNTNWSLTLKMQHRSSALSPCKSRWKTNNLLFYTYLNVNQQTQHSWVISSLHGLLIVLALALCGPFVWNKISTSWDLRRGPLRAL